MLLEFHCVPNSVVVSDSICNRDFAESELVRYDTMLASPLHCQAALGNLGIQSSCSAAMIKRHLYVKPTTLHIPTASNRANHIQAHTDSISSNVTPPQTHSREQWTLTSVVG
jgi:hypothetical protein